MLLKFAFNMTAQVRLCFKEACPAHVYAIVRHSEEGQRNSKIKEDQFMFRYNNRGVAATKVERLGYYMDVEE
jgi:hypothetical protein